MGKSMHAMDGVNSKCTCGCNGGGRGSIFAILVHMQYFFKAL